MELPSLDGFFESNRKMPEGWNGRCCSMSIDPTLDLENTMRRRKVFPSSPMEKTKMEILLKFEKIWENLSPEKKLEIWNNSKLLNSLPPVIEDEPFDVERILYPRLQFSRLSFRQIYTDIVWNFITSDPLYSAILQNTVSRYLFIAPMKTLASVPSVINYGYGY